MWSEVASPQCGVWREGGRGGREGGREGGRNHVNM